MTRRTMRRTTRHGAAIRVLAALGLLVAPLAGCRTLGSPTPLAEADAAVQEAMAAEQATGAAPAPIAPGGLRTVGVVPLRASDSSLVPLGYALADLLLTDLSRSRQLRVVERAQLHALLRELDLAASGRVDSASAPRAGRLLRASDLVLGGIASSGTGLRVDSRVADVASGRVDVAVSADTRLDDVLAAQSQIALRVFERLGVSLTPAERAAIEARPTRSLSALLAYGRAVRYEVEGNYAAAAAEYARAVREDRGFAAARDRAYDLRAHADVWPLPVVPVTGGSSPGGYTASTGTLGTTLVDRINRPFSGGTSSGASSPADPSFPGTQVTIIITVVLP